MRSAVFSTLDWHATRFHNFWICFGLIEAPVPSISWPLSLLFNNTHKGHKFSPCEHSFLFVFLVKEKKRRFYLNIASNLSRSLQPKLFDYSILFSLVKLFFFFFKCAHLLIDKPMVITEPAVAEAARFDTKSFRYKLKQWKCPKILVILSIVCEWTRKTFQVNIFVL